MERLFVLLNSWDILFTLLSNSFDPRVMLSRRILGTTAFRERLPPGFSSELPLLLFASFFLFLRRKKTNNVENWIHSYFLGWTRDKEKGTVAENTKQLNTIVRTKTLFSPVILLFLLHLPSPSQGTNMFFKLYQGTISEKILALSTHQVKNTNSAMIYPHFLPFFWTFVFFSLFLIFVLPQCSSFL